MIRNVKPSGGSGANLTRDGPAMHRAVPLPVPNLTQRQRLRRPVQPHATATAAGLAATGMAMPVVTEVARRAMAISTTSNSASASLAASEHLCFA